MEIVKAAFTVWGRKFFRTTSLTELAGELGVTKPALYRHFPSKKALLDAMYEYYLDTYGVYIKPYIEEVLTAGDIVQGLRILIRTMTGFNFRNRYLFIFSLVQRHGDGRACAITGEFRRWGIDIPRLEALEGKGGYPYRLHLALASQAFFVAAQFKKCGGGGGDMKFSEKKIEKLSSYVEEKILRGLGFNKEAVDVLDFDALESLLPRTLFDGEADDGLLKAVAGAVAEAGPWNASMEMVARRSGLSKSSLYSHFKNRQDMMAQLFLLELERMHRYARTSIERGRGPLEQFYLGLLAIADYLRSRPEILITMDWVKTRRIELDITPEQDTLAIFSDIPAIARLDKELVPNWVFYWTLFLIITTLVSPPGDAKKRRLKGPGTSDGVFRKVFRFIALGAEGL
ncbi:MAG: TetR/AcrR family transcriptional regulator [Spirochaetaceae bacterium]|nr:TetR/AcrR family transcriptional regulator [Spirochaetaceae bacterium]